MTTLGRELRKQFETTIIQARRVAEEGARKTLEQLAVHHHEPYPTMTREQRALRNRLRAHGRQLGDKLDEKRDTQTIDRLTQECAYEHWHRMLFARFLAESQLLIEPESGMAISLDDCRELAQEKNIDWLQLASQFAVGMLPQIFRTGDPVLEISLPPETRQELEGLLKSLSHEVFVADDSLGWVYQFWQTKRKYEVNKSEKKIGADELAAVTQLFTEDYMVLFLLHNTLGAWWAGKVLASNSKIASQAKDEDELRAACSVGGYEWTYLRFVREGGKGPWRPAAGTFDGWPRVARDLKILDPCEGSGHFLVTALPILVAIRMGEEGLSRASAVDGVLRDNLFGLELDTRCTQIAAFNLALGAWRLAGYRLLPTLNIACSGLGINTSESEWLKLAADDERAREAMHRIYSIFKEAPTLGSLIDPHRFRADLYVAGAERVLPLLERAMEKERASGEVHELANAAQGIVAAFRTMSNQFTLVTTNVPYLGRGRQHEDLRKHCDEFYSDAAADLAACFIDRCLSFCSANGTIAIVTKQEPLFLKQYKGQRKRLLQSIEWNYVARLGPRAFAMITGERVNVALLCLTNRPPSKDHILIGSDFGELKTPGLKAAALVTQEFSSVLQQQQVRNPDSRIVLETTRHSTLLGDHASALAGHLVGDSVHFERAFWEIDVINDQWEFLQSTVETTMSHGGRSGIILWEKERGQMYDLAQSVRHLNHVAQNWLRGKPNWGKRGIVISQMGNLAATLYLGQIYDCNCCAIVPKRDEDLASIWAYSSSNEFSRNVRQLDQKMNVAPHTLLKVPFDSVRWDAVARKVYPAGLPVPFSGDPTQWIFSGQPKASNHPLQVAVARLLGYRWPRQTGSGFLDCPTLGSDGLEYHADVDGIACLSPVKGELPAADRLRALLADSFGKEWSGGTQAQLLSQAGYDGGTIEEWLRDSFFGQHCDLFQQRPFIWHIWDGLRNGFHALVNYHRLAAPKGEGRRTFEKLIYAYLGDWIKQQRDDQKRDIEGADARVAAAEHLKAELEKILEGKLLYDIFVRWKPLHEQPIGWEPDLNDGVRINIRPFMTATTLNGRGKSSCILRVAPKIKWEKDRGKEPDREKDAFPWFWGWDESYRADFAGGPEFDGNRWNDLHYTREFKRRARQGKAGA